MAFIRQKNNITDIILIHVISFGLQNQNLFIGTNIFTTNWNFYCYIMEGILAPYTAPGGRGAIGPHTIMLCRAPKILSATLLGSLNCHFSLVSSIASRPSFCNYTCMFCACVCSVPSYKYISKFPRQI